MLAVLVFHTSELTGTVGFGLGGRFAEIAATQGVLTFFGISGFLLYRPYVAGREGQGTPPALGAYLRRRVLRVVPAYWVVLTLLAIYPGLTGVFSGDWWRYYGYLQIYSVRTDGLGLAVAWTLCVEVSFYVLLPLWAAMMDRISQRDRGVRTELASLAVVVVAGILVTCLSGAHHLGSGLGGTLAGECTWFALGMGLAVVSVEREGREHALRWLPECLWALAAACYLGLMALVPSGGLFGLIAEANRPVSGRVTLERSVLEVVLTLSLLSTAAIPGRRRGLPERLLASSPMAGLGVISYSFYLWHLPIVELLATHSSTAFSATGWNVMAHVHTARTGILFVLALILTLIVATISYRLVERPFLMLKEAHRSHGHARISWRR